MSAVLPIPVLVSVPIGLLALAAFATGSGMRMLDPLLPLVAQDLGVTVADAASLVAGFVLPYGLVQLAAGPCGDTFGKLRVACVSLLLFGLATLASGLAPGLLVLVGLRAASGFFAGAVIPLLIAHVGDTVPYAERQGALGRFATGMVMAQLLAGPIAGIIAEFASWRVPFLLLGMLSLVVAGVLAARLGPALRHSPPHSASGGRSRYAGLFARPAGRWLLLVAFFDGFWLFGGAFPFVGAFLIVEFGRNAAEAGLVVAGFGIGAFIYTRLAPRLVRRFGERWMLLAGGFGLALGLAGLALAPGWQWVAGLQLFLGLAFYLFHGVLQARATELLPEARGTAVSGFALALFLGQSAGSLGFALGLAVIGYRGAFLFAACGVLALTIFCQRPIRS